MHRLKKPTLTLKAIKQLGIRSSLYYALYKIGLWSGYFKYRTPSAIVTRDHPPHTKKVNWIITLPKKEDINRLLQHKHDILISQAKEIISGKARLFGDQPVAIKLKPPGTLHHWTAYEQKKENWGIEDIKYIWEPARFGWTYPLGRAYLLTNDDSYAQSFWQLFGAFEESNPANMGQNWTSAQEVALRLMAMVFAAHIFNNAESTSQRKFQNLIQAIVTHADRIPLTICYAQAQNNNHWLTEGVALFTAGTFLKEYPKASQWRKLGWKWFNQAIKKQITDDGIYIQHSMNYHRLMLHSSLWMQMVTKAMGGTLPLSTVEKLAAATRWLLAQIDPISGQAPNLGHNDGSLILPLSTAEYYDFRPVAQSSSRAFLGKAYLPTGPWDELSLWLGLDITDTPVKIQAHPFTPAVLRIGDKQSYAILRATNFNSRPAHADQLHVDLWFKGHNVALDAGTYQYNAPPPWENALASTLVHNTISIDGKDQMQRAGRFLWLDWAQAKVIKYTDEEIIADHDGYQKIGIIHRRSLKRIDKYHWIIKDQLLSHPHQVSKHQFSLHWLTPDWKWENKKNNLLLRTPFGKLQIKITWQPLNNQARYLPPTLQILRAGKALIGSKPKKPIFGWFSPIYGKKVPALSIRYTVESLPPIAITSKWTFMENQNE
ncbi:MAG TPA: hypothetical protein G4N92_05835 [Anaerolineae bacterium]|nr:hypothetical protein [Anaerolineae bacterium]